MELDIPGDKEDGVENANLLLWLLVSPRFYLGRDLIVRTLPATIADLLILRVNASGSSRVLDITMSDIRAWWSPVFGLGSGFFSKYNRRFLPPSSREDWC